MSDVRRTAYAAVTLSVRIQLNQGWDPAESVSVIDLRAGAEARDRLERAVKAMGPGCHVIGRPTVEVTLRTESTT